jgi:hypothetical protein
MEHIVQRGDPAMSAVNILAGIAVKDLKTAISWYSDLLDRIPDIQPMDGLAEWEFEGGGWLQLFEDDARAGHSSATIADNDLEGRVHDLNAKGIAISHTGSSESVRIAIIADPDGNQIVFAQGFDEIHRSTT